MSVTAASEAEEAHQIANDAAVAQFNGNSLDITTENVDPKQFVDVAAKDEDHIQSSLTNASTDAGATQDGIDKNEGSVGSQGLDGVDIPTAPETQDSNLDAFSLEQHTTPATPRNHELPVNQSSELEEVVPIEGKVPEADFVPPSSMIVPISDDQDASTTTPGSEQSINDPVPAADVAAVEEKTPETETAPPSIQAPILNDEDTSNVPTEVASTIAPEVQKLTGDSVHPALEDVAVEEKAPAAASTPLISETTIVDHEDMSNLPTEVASTATPEAQPVFAVPEDTAVEDKAPEAQPAPPSSDEEASNLSAEVTSTITPEAHLSTDKSVPAVVEDIAVEEKALEPEVPPLNPESLVLADEEPSTEVASTIAPEILPTNADAGVLGEREEKEPEADPVPSSSEPIAAAAELTNVPTDAASVIAPDVHPIPASADEIGSVDQGLPVGSSVSIPETTPTSTEDSAVADVTLVEVPPTEDIISAAKVEADTQSIAVESGAAPEDDVAAETTFIDPVSVSPKLVDDSAEDSAFTETSQASDPAVILQTPLEDTSVSTAEPTDDAILASGSPILEASFIPDVAEPPLVDIISSEAEEVDPVEDSAKEEQLDDHDASGLLPARESDIERPKSPWTPSYSVTTQGPGISPNDEEEIAELPALPPSVNASTDSDSAPVLAQVEPTVTVTGTQDAEAEIPQPTDVPRPWTPSYSVVVQGSPLDTPQEESAVELGKAEIVTNALEDVGGEPLALVQNLEHDEEEIPTNHPMTSTIQPGVIVDHVDPATLQDPDVEDDSLADPGSEAIVAALIESDVLAQDNVDQEILSVTAPQDAISEDFEAPSRELDTVVEAMAAEEPAFDEVPASETLLTTAQSVPERPWTPSYTVTQQGSLEPSEGEPEAAPAPPSHQEMFTSEQDDFVKPTVDISALDAPVDPPRASSPWTPSYSVSVQGSPLPDATKLLDADELVNEVQQPEGVAEQVQIADAAEAAADPDPDAVRPTVDTSALEAPADPPRASSPWTPSYSVSVQGSPLPGATKLLDADELVEEPEAAAEQVQIVDVAEPAVDPVPDVVQPMVDTSALEAPVDAPRPSSPWTPSYSVSVQGSPLPVTTQLLDADKPVVDIDQSAAAAEEMVDVAEAAVDSVPDIVQPTVDTSALEAPVEPPRPSSPWTPSYSVLVQGSPLPVATRLADSAHDADDLVGDVQQPEGAEQVQTADVAEPAVDPVPDVVQPTMDTSALEAPVDAPRPSSPWTVSYSVSVQGSPLPVAAQLVDSGLEADDLVGEIQPLDSTQQTVEHAEVTADRIPDSTQSVIQPTVDILDAPVDPPRASSPWTPSYSVSVQGSPLPASTELVVPVLEAEQILNTVEAAADPVPDLPPSFIPPTVEISALEVDAPLDPPRASSPWTPSYSVSVQGSPRPGATELLDAGLEADSLAAPVDQPEAAAERVVDIVDVEPVSDSVQSEVISSDFIPPLEATDESSSEPLADESTLREVVVEEVIAEFIDQPAESSATASDLDVNDSILSLDPTAEEPVVERSIPESEEIRATTEPLKEPVVEDLETIESNLEPAESGEILEESRPPAEDVYSATADPVSAEVSIDSKTKQPSVVEEAVAPTQDTEEAPAIVDESANQVEDVAVSASGTEVIVPTGATAAVSDADDLLNAAEGAAVADSTSTAIDGVQSESAPEVEDNAVLSETTSLEPIATIVEVTPNEEVVVQVDAAPAEEEHSDPPVTEAQELPQSHEEATDLPQADELVPSQDPVSESVPIESDSVKESIAIGVIEPAVFAATAAVVANEIVDSVPVQALEAHLVDNKDSDAVPDAEWRAVAVEPKEAVAAQGGSSLSAAATSDVGVEQDLASEAVAVNEKSPPAHESSAAGPEQDVSEIAEPVTGQDAAPVVDEAPTHPIDSIQDSVPAVAVPVADEKSEHAEPDIWNMADSARESADTPLPKIPADDEPAVVTESTSLDTAPVLAQESEVEIESTEEPFKAEVANIAPEFIPTIVDDVVSGPTSVPNPEESSVADTAAEVDAAVDPTVLYAAAETELLQPPIADSESTTGLSAEVNATDTSTTMVEPVPVPSSVGATAVDEDSAPPADVSIAQVDAEVANDETPVASVVPLPTESQPLAFPLMLDLSEPVDVSDDADESHLDAIPPLSPRSRLESTASSIFFPGGWFSRVPEGRASLNVAQGEFTPSKPTSPSVPSPSVPSPSVPSAETEQSEEKKGKWCVVM